MIPNLNQGGAKFMESDLGGYSTAGVTQWLEELGEELFTEMLHLRIDGV